MNCIDLKERFGRQYRIAYEESYYAERGDAARGADPWLMIIPCQFGHLFPWGGDTLAASTNTRGGTARRLMELAGVTVAQDGDDGVTVLFPVGMTPQVAEIMRPRRRRHLSPEARRAASERLAKYRRQHAVELSGEALISAIGT